MRSKPTRLCSRKTLLAGLCGALGLAISNFAHAEESSARQS